jgi:hypothetical protein
MLAYSTVGICTPLGIGGGSARFSVRAAGEQCGGEVHALPAAGNILAAYRTKTEDGVRGMLQAMPVSAGLGSPGSSPSPARRPSACFLESG